MRKRIAVLSLVAGAAFAQDAGDLVGRWRSVEASKGGIGAMCDFGADGAVHFSPGAIVPPQYGLQGDRLTLLPPNDGMTYSVSWTGANRMKLTVKGIGTEEYSRLGIQQDPQNKLMGEWIGTRDLDGKQSSCIGYSVIIGMQL